jgi:seryl-tRNA synthetase
MKTGRDIAMTLPDDKLPPSVPWFGARKLATALLAETQNLRAQRDEMRKQLETLGILSVIQLEEKRANLQREIAEQVARLAQERSAAATAVQELQLKLVEVRKSIVDTEDLTLLQESGIYRYRHPLTDAVAYAGELAKLEDKIKAMARKDGGAVQGSTNWTVNGSLPQGRVMVRDFSKLMLRAFNAEADNLVRGLKPYKLPAAIDRLKKVAETIERLGKTMQIRISTSYLQLRVQELELTADFLQKQAEEKEAERIERERLREERKVAQEIERERVRLEKERQHYANALEALVANGDEAGAARMREQLDDVRRAIEDVDYRAANIRAGYVYVISNIGSFGERMVKVGMTRRLDPMDRIRELSDASVPFNFDVHALYFSKDAVGIEAAMHERLTESRVNLVNRRREFFRATPLEAKAHLAELAGELLQFQDVPEALEYRQCLTRAQNVYKPE